MPAEILWAAVFCSIMLIAAINARALGASLVAALAVTVLYPTYLDVAVGVIAFLGVASVAAAFRD